MAGEYETVTVVWCDLEIAVSYQADWLSSGQWHIELRCAARLPVTQPGYRSHFVQTDAIADAEDVPTFVMAWLDVAAQDPTWLRHLEDSKQLKLF